MGSTRRASRGTGGRRLVAVSWIGAAAVLAAAPDRSSASPPPSAGSSTPADGAEAGGAAVLHEIPSDVTIVAWVVPGGDRLTVLVRVPLEAMRDFEFPVVGPGYLDVEAAGPLLDDAARLWVADYVSFFEDGRPLPRPVPVAQRISLPSDRSFGRYDDALAHFGEPPVRTGTALPWEQALLDLRFEIPISDPEARFSVDPRWAHLGLRTTTVLRFRPPGRGDRVFQVQGDPGLVRLDPSWLQAAFRFVRLGFEHILDGLDHLLFLFCLVIPFRRARGLLPVITAFTVAHSITLIGSALGIAPAGGWFPPFIETLIALSIVYMAFENIVGARLDRRWMIAFGFGLIHGFGFSFALRETLQFAGGHLLTSLLAFNVGVELGQIAVVAVLVPALGLLYRRTTHERTVTILLSALVAHGAWHWMTERGSVLAQYRVAWPALELPLIISLMRWLMLALIVGGALWLLRGPFRRWSAQGDPASP